MSYVFGEAVVRAMRGFLTALDALAVAESRNAPEVEVLELADQVTLARLGLVTALTEAGWTAPNLLHQVLNQDTAARRIGVSAIALIDEIDVTPA